jgi:hypothetical protein
MIETRYVDHVGAYVILPFHRGATCYLNSLIQSMYMTPELREGMFSIDPVELGVDLVSFIRMK